MKNLAGPGKHLLPVPKDEQQCENQDHQAQKRVIDNTAYQGIITTAQGKNPYKEKNQDDYYACSLDLLVAQTCTSRKRMISPLPLIGEPARSYRLPLFPARTNSLLLF